MGIRVLSLLFVAGLSACTSLEPVPEYLSHDAYACMQRYSPDNDPMQRASGEAVPESSFFRINQSRDALEYRLALTDSATESLDIQYFLWRADDTGSLLIRHVLAAADRGVHVRMLIDDLDSINWEPLARALNQHDKVEIRVFNPFLKGRGGWGQRGRELLIDLDRMNHRMHNKLFKADRTAAIVGGRNIGDEYFGAGSKLDYRDYDVIAIGPVVDELTESFDVFWNSDWSYPLDVFPSGGQEEIGLQGLHAELERRIADSELIAREYRFESTDWPSLIADARAQLSSGQSRAVYDCPPGQGDQQFPVQTAFTLNQIAQQTRQEILVVSPYVVPLQTIKDYFREGSAAGINITILTNSLAAADHTYAFSGYSKHRREMLEMGIELRELRPDGPLWSEHKTGSSDAAHVSLHAKLIIFDRRWVYVGSLNFDPRSVHWNTELGLLIDSTTFAEQIYQDFAGDLSPKNSWRVELRTLPQQDSGIEYDVTKLFWVAGDEETDREPSRGVGQRISNWFFSLFPLDEQL